MAGRTGFGIVVGFASGFHAEITGVDHSGIKRESVDVSSSDSPSGWMEFIPSSLIDAGELKVEMRFKPGTIPPIDQPAETVTVTFPLAGTETTAGSFVADGFLTEYEYTGPMDDAMGCTATLKFTGPLTINPPS